MGNRWIEIRVVAALVAVLVCGTACAQKKPKNNLSGYDRSARATVVHPAIVYAAAEDNAAHVTEVEPGHEVVVTEHNGAWVKVFANTDIPDEQAEDQKPEFSADEDVSPMSGWIKDKGLVTPTTVNGDAVLFGTAANYEKLAMEPHAPKDAAEEAHLLYRRVVEYYPNSPLAAEAMYRSADVRWQIDKVDIRTLPSAHEQEAYLRPQLYEGELQKVMKLYPNTKFAALAAYDLIDNKLCGDWQGASKCPLKEAEIYEKYMKDYPQSPATPEAIYQAAWRWSALLEIYKTEGESKKSEEAKTKATALATTVAAQFPQSDWGARAQRLLYLMGQDIPTYGNAPD